MTGNKIDFSIVIKRMRSIWIVCFGTLAVLSVCGLLVGYVLVPYVAFLLMGVVVWFGNHNLHTSSINCSLMTHYTFYTLFFSGLIMLGINLLNTKIIVNSFSEFNHTDIPFHASIIVYPVATVCYGIAMLRGGKPEYCKACKASSGFSVSESLRRNVLHHEAKRQVMGAFGCSLFLSVAVWAYYFLYYTDVSVTTPDRFFLYFVPLLFYIVTVFYCLSRYSSMQYEVSLSIKENVAKSSQLVRYMIVRGDEVYLNEIASSVDHGLSLWDTPVTASYDIAHEINEYRTRRKFEDITGLKDFSMRFLFNTNVNNMTVHHYAVFLPEESAEPAVGGSWFNLYALDSMLKSGLITRAFAYELHRIFTITMAWKTYTRQGKRLYPIKNYRPTFRLRDFKDWDVDYSDLAWISVAENNEDKPLFRLRQFWREHISGVDKRWKRENTES